jgi:hypothetical protein
MFSIHQCTSKWCKTIYKRESKEHYSIID